MLTTRRTQEDKDSALVMIHKEWTRKMSASEQDTRVWRGLGNRTQAISADVVRMPEGQKMESWLREASSCVRYLRTGGPQHRSDQTDQII
jgi:hypothetical protein